MIFGGFSDQNRKQSWIITATLESVCNVVGMAVNAQGQVEAWPPGSGRHFGAFLKWRDADDWTAHISRPIRAFVSVGPNRSIKEPLKNSF